MLRTLRDSLGGVGRWPRLLAIAACLLLAGVSALGAADHSTSGNGHAPSRTLPVVVAARDLPVGRLLAARDLSVARWPPGIRPPGSARVVSARVGERLAGPLRTGEAVTATRVVGTELTDGLDPGLAAVPVSLPDPHAGELIRPGEHVELLATPRDDLDLGLDGEGTGTPNRGSAASVTVVAHRLLVLAVLPGSDDGSTSVVVAADAATTLGIAEAQSAQVLLAVPVSPRIR